MTYFVPLLALAVATPQKAPSPPKEAAAQFDARMRWWREARFGMFIHWGLYAVPAGKWGNETGHGEWIRDTARIPVDEYEKLLGQFNPVKFNADAWARMAKDAGMKYLVLTSKHHDGFALFDSKYTDWDVMSTPFRRDIVRELAQACRRHGVKLGLYHSIMDWHHPDYLPRRGWEASTRPATGANMDRYVAYLRNQVTEILTNYGDVAVVWFDGEWESTWNDGYGRPLYDLCRKLQPKTIINNRVSNNRGGSMIDSGNIRVGDFATPEQYIPDTGLATDWESCMTMNSHWGWNAYDRNWKSTQTLIRNLADTASKGGNYLLNIGPRADGTFPPEAVDRLKGIGAWMRQYGDSIYGTSPSPFRSLSWGRCTRKGNRLYLHLFDVKRSEIDLPGLATDVKEAKVMGTSKRLEFTRSGPTTTLRVPDGLPDVGDVVIQVDLAGPPVVYNTPQIEAVASDFVSRVEARVKSEGVELRYTTDGSEPRADSPKVSGPIAFGQSGTLKVAGFQDGKQVSPTATRAFRKVSPLAATEVVTPIPGLKLEEYAGTWDTLPDFAKFTPRSTSVADDITPAESESVARRYSGYIFASETEMYRFALTSDDGARLWIDGQLVVDNDGLHAAETKMGTVPLAKGWHRIELAWFNRTGGRALSLRMAPVGVDPRPIQPAMLAHRP